MILRKAKSTLKVYCGRPPCPNAVTVTTAVSPTWRVSGTTETSRFGADQDPAVATRVGVGVGVAVGMGVGVGVGTGVPVGRGAGVDVGNASGGEMVTTTFLSLLITTMTRASPSPSTPLQSTLEPAAMGLTSRVTTTFGR